MPKVIPNQSFRLTGSNLGDFYEFVEGESLEEMLINGQNSQIDLSQIEQISFNKIIESLKDLYDEKTNLIEFSESLKKGNFHKKTTQRLGEDVGGFIEYYNTIYNGVFENSKHTIVHGDLHQGNIFVGKSVKLIDFDNIEKGLPYQDFFHLAVISDFERSSNFEFEKMKFLEYQNKLLDNGVTDEQTKLIEFETYLSFLNRYYTAANNGDYQDEHKCDVLKSCTYLLEQAKKSIMEYSIISDNSKIVNLFDEFAQEKFGSLENIILKKDESPSIAFAHTVNHKFRANTKENASQENWLQHYINTKELVRRDEIHRSSGYQALVGVGGVMFGLFVMDYAFHPEETLEFLNSNDFKNNILTPLSVLAGLSYLSYNIETIENKVKNGINYIKNII